MKIRCAWCEEEMGEKPPYDDFSTTHSICTNCLAKQLKAVHKPATPSPAFKRRLLEEISCKKEDRMMDN